MLALVGKTANTQVANPFSEALHEFIMRRIDDSFDASPDLKQDYSEVAAKQGELYKAIRSMLPEEGQKLLLQFDDGSTRLACIESQSAYKQGLRDGVRFGNVLGGGNSDE